MNQLAKVTHVVIGEKWQDLVHSVRESSHSANWFEVAHDYYTFGDLPSNGVIGVVPSNFLGVLWIDLSIGFRNAQSITEACVDRFGFLIIVIQTSECSTEAASSGWLSNCLEKGAACFLVNTQDHCIETCLGLHLALQNIFVERSFPPIDYADLRSCFSGRRGRIRLRKGAIFDPDLFRVLNNKRPLRAFMLFILLSNVHDKDKLSLNYLENVMSNMDIAFPSGIDTALSVSKPLNFRDSCTVQLMFY